MKRLVFCFDGTWNKLNPDAATNVVLTAASIRRVDSEGVPQVIHYDEGVGTGPLDKHTGGMFGTGLVTNLREAYRFLIFNYDPGDEIYVFGFSRGAYTARSFVGFLRHVGPLRRLHVGRIDEALQLYQDRLEKKPGSGEALRRFRAEYASGVCIGAADEEWRCRNVPGYAPGDAPELRIKFLGVWDTVGALGWPEIIPRSDWQTASTGSTIRASTRSLEAPPCVGFKRAPPAVPARLVGRPDKAERRPWLSKLTIRSTVSGALVHGVRSSVGGGGDIRSLSDVASADRTSAQATHFDEGTRRPGHSGRQAARL